MVAIVYTCMCCFYVANGKQFMTLQPHLPCTHQPFQRVQCRCMLVVRDKCLLTPACDHTLHTLTQGVTPPNTVCKVVLGRLAAFSGLLFS